MNEHDPRNKLLVEPTAVPITNSTPTALPNVELVQQVPIFLPTPPTPLKSYTIVERTPSSNIPHVRPMEAMSKPMLY